VFFFFEETLLRSDVMAVILGVNPIEKINDKDMRTVTIADDSRHCVVVQLWDIYASKIDEAMKFVPGTAPTIIALHSVTVKPYMTRSLVTCGGTNIVQVTGDQGNQLRLWCRASPEEVLACLSISAAAPSRAGDMPALTLETASKRTVGWMREQHAKGESEADPLLKPGVVVTAVIRRVNHEPFFYTACSHHKCAVQQSDVGEWTCRSCTTAVPQANIVRIFRFQIGIAGTNDEETASIVMLSVFDRTAQRLLGHSIDKMMSWHSSGQSVQVTTAFAALLGKKIKCLVRGQFRNGALEMNAGVIQVLDTGAAAAGADLD